MDNFKTKYRKEVTKTIALGSDSLIFSSSLMANPIIEDRENKQTLQW